jgi:hypothetical protein
VVPGAEYDSYTWLWDTQWLGSKTRATSPMETTEWLYQQEKKLDGALSGAGRLGRVTQAKRTFTGLGPATFQYVYDLQGHDLRTTFPSGASRTSTWAGSWLVRQAVDEDGGGADVTLRYGYDAQGRSTGWYDERATATASSPAGPARPRSAGTTGAGATRRA